MRTETLAWSHQAGWDRRPTEFDSSVDLVLYFGDRATLSADARYRELREVFPRAIIASCSTGGQILGNDVLDEGIAGAAISFDNTQLKSISIDVPAGANSFVAGATVASSLALPGLSAVLVLADGLRVNGTELVAGLTSSLDPEVRVFGGLAGDGMAFDKTLVGVDEAPQQGRVAAIGFYGDALRVGTGVGGGWHAFGPRRKITRSEENVLYELDGKPALDLYDRYLGEEAKALPASGLFFPLKIYHPERPDHDIVRTLLAVDRAARSITFAGNLPEGWVAQLMLGSHDRLVAGAFDASQQAHAGLGSLSEDSLTLLFSCIGRKAIMSQRVVDEIEATLPAAMSHTTALGFYSYGEISPHASSGICEFHNQMMTIAVLTEASP